MLQHRRRIDRVARPRHHQQQRPLVPFRVRARRSTAASATSGCETRDVLQRDRADPFAAGLDHVLRAVGDLHEAVGIDGRDVAGGEPAVGVAARCPARRRNRRCTPTGRAPSGRRTACRPTAVRLPSPSTIFMSMPARTRPCFSMWRTAALAGQPGLRRLRRVVGADRAELGHAPAMLDRDAVFVAERLDQQRRRGGAAGHDALHRRPASRRWRADAAAGRARRSARRRSCVTRSCVAASAARLAPSRCRPGSTSAAPVSAAA